MIECLEELKTIDRFICPVGGGGLLAGCASVLKRINPNAEIVAVEPESANDFCQSLAERKLISIDTSQSKTIADGLLVPSVGELNWELLKNKVDVSLPISDTDILLAMRYLMNQHSMVVEPSGAIAVAALSKLPAISGITVCAISGGNVDNEVFRHIWNV